MSSPSRRKRSKPIVPELPSYTEPSQCKKYDNVLSCIKSPNKCTWRLDTGCVRRPRNKYDYWLKPSATDERYIIEALHAELLNEQIDVDKYMSLLNTLNGYYETILKDQLSAIQHLYENDQNPKKKNDLMILKEELHKLLNRRHDSTLTDVSFTLDKTKNKVDSKTPIDVIKRAVDTLYCHFRINIDMLLLHIYDMKQMTTKQISELDAREKSIRDFATSFMENLVKYELKLISTFVAEDDINAYVKNVMKNLDGFIQATKKEHELLYKEIERELKQRENETIVIKNQLRKRTVDLSKKALDMLKRLSQNDPSSADVFKSTVDELIKRIDDVIIEINKTSDRIVLIDIERYIQKLDTEISDYFMTLVNRLADYIKSQLNILELHNVDTRPFVNLNDRDKFHNLVQTVIIDKLQQVFTTYSEVMQTNEKISVLLSISRVFDCDELDLNEIFDFISNIQVELQLRLSLK